MSDYFDGYSALQAPLTEYPVVLFTSTNEYFKPVPATAGSSGIDLPSIEATEVLPGETKLVKTGISVAIEPGFEFQVRSRSGLSLKKQVVVLNSPGTIDSDYRGEICVILHNFGKEVFTINKGDRIAQLVMAEVYQGKWKQVKTLEDTNRSSGGFGSTGLEAQKS